MPGVAEMVGRELELATVERFLRGQAPRALVLEGDAGIGKTTIWRAGLAAAPELGLTVMRCRAAGSEVRLSFAGLADLLEQLPPEIVSQLPAPQREALEVALLLRAPPVEGVDVRAVGSAVRGALRALAADGSVLVAIDDLQWLDAASAHALGFALRRLELEPIGVLATMRPDPDRRPLLELGSTGIALEHVVVGPLSLGALQRLLRLQTGFRPARPLLVRLHETSAGNPFYALEIVRALAHEDFGSAFDRPLPAPPSVSEAIGRRLAALPDGSRAALLELAARGRGDVPLVEELMPAIESGFVEAGGGRARFGHPLLAATVYAEASDEERRAAHTRLSSQAIRTEERARHLALAAFEPDEHVAATVAAAADDALRRGATTEALELYERAVALTPHGNPDALADRVLGAAEANRRAGNEDGGRCIARAGLEQVPEGRARTRLLVWLADAEGTVEAADAAVASASDDPDLFAAALNARSEALQVADDVAAALADAERALAAARVAGDRSLLVRSLAHVGHLEVMSGRSQGVERLEEACALQDPGDAATIIHGPATALAIVRLWRDELDEARPALEEQERRANELGEERARASILQRLARAELWAGNVPRALELADELVELKEGEGWDDPVGGLWVRSLAFAHLGRVEEARADAERARRLAVLQGDPDHFHVVYARGFAEATAGDHAAAADLLERLPGLVAATGTREPGICPFHADELEALVRSGRLDRAASRIDVVELEAKALDRPRLLVAAARGRGLLAETQGRRDDAIASFQVAVAATERLAVPFERGRALLDLGAALRRARRQAAAREALTAARDVFDELGAEPWAIRARHELGRFGGRSRSEALTATEARVASLAAEGRSTKEIASVLVVSAKTVEKHLTSIYAKLGVRSRAELAARYASR